MAHPFNRALIACSVSALALAIVTLYYWQLRKRRKSSDTSCSSSEIENDDSRAATTNICVPHTSNISNCNRNQSTINSADNIRVEEKHSGQTGKKETENESDSSFVDTTAVAASTLAADIKKEEIFSGGGGDLSRVSSLLVDEKEAATQEAPTDTTDCSDVLSAHAAAQSTNGDRDNVHDIRKLVVEPAILQASVSTQLTQLSPSQPPTSDFQNKEEEPKQPSIDDHNHPVLGQSIAPVTDNSSANDYSEKISVINSASSLTDIAIDTMHLKSSENPSTLSTSCSADTADNLVDLVGKMKNRLSLEEESATSNNLKISSIENDSKSSNSILTIEVVKSSEKQNVMTNTMQPISSTDLAEKLIPTEESTKNDDQNGELRSLQESNTTSSSSNRNDDMVSNVFKKSNNLLSGSDESEQSPSAGEKQVNPRPQKPRAVWVSRNVQPDQTFAQVLSSKNSGNSSSANKVTKTTAPTPGCNGHNNEDAYANFPDSSPSSDGQFSPNSEFGESSDVHSQGSNDSGKGGTIFQHTDSAHNGDQSSTNSYHVVNSDFDDQLICYQFEMPHFLCGKLIGTNGHYINHLKERTNTKIVVNSSYFTPEIKICSITGLKSSVKNALNQIRKRFPLKDYPNVTLAQLNIPSPTVPTIPLTQACQLHLLPDIVTDVILSCTIDAGHFFLQQPTHPSYTQLNQLDLCMKVNYSQADAPVMPHVHPGIICAAPTAEGWYRALIKAVHEPNAECDIMFVDYGGYAYNVPVSNLRQIRYDFMSLPFQASECYLANVVPIDAENGWSDEANALFQELAQGQIIYSVISGFAESGIPLVNLFKLEGTTRIFFNKQLVEHGHAYWVENNSQS